MNIGLGIGIPFTRSSLWASIFTPSTLFLDGSTQGVWYDPSDINLTWRRNLLTYSEQFDNSVWGKSGASITPDATTAPDGTLTADFLVPSTSSSSLHRFFSDTGYTPASTSVSSIYLKAGGYRYCALIFNDLNNAVAVDLQDGLVTYLPSTIASASLTDAGDGWWLLSVSNKTPGFHRYFGVYVFNTVVTSNSWPTWTGDGTSGIYIWGAQLEQGSTATPYQRITDGIQDYLQYQAQPVLYRDAAGTLPVTAVEQPVGLMLDKSKGLVLGSELVTNGDFSNGTTGWSLGDGWAIVGGQAVRSPSAFGSVLQQPISVTAGKTYKVTYTITAYSAQNVQVIIDGGTQVLGAARASIGTVTEYLTAKTGNTTLWMTTSSKDTSLTIDNISVRELPGNHAFNPSGNSANFPVLSARYNEFEKTEQFDNAYWGKVGCVVSAPELVGTVLANKVTPSGTNFVNKVITRTGKVRFSVKPNGVRYLLLYQYGSSTFKDAVFDLQLATITRAAAGVSASISLRPDGFLDLAITQSDVVSIESGVQAVDAGTSPANQSYAGGGSYYLSRADLRVANDALGQPAYQRVNTATDYDTVGFKPYLRFNGVNQWLQTNSIDFSYSDKMFVCAGVRKLSDAVGADLDIIAELSTASEVSNGAFALIGSNGFGGSQKTAQFNSKGTALVTAESTSTNYAAPITYLLSSIGNISGDQAILRVNGAQAAISTSDQGTGNYGNYPLYIGARAGSSLWFNGRLYQLVIAAGSEIRVAEEDSDLFLSESGDYITAETTVAVIQSAIEQTEAFVNRKTSAF